MFSIEYETFEKLLQRSELRKKERKGVRAKKGDDHCIGKERYSLPSLTSPFLVARVYVCVCVCACVCVFNFGIGVIMRVCARVQYLLQFLTSLSVKCGAVVFNLFQLSEPLCFSRYYIIILLNVHKSPIYRIFKVQLVEPLGSANPGLKTTDLEYSIDFTPSNKQPLLVMLENSMNFERVFKNGNFDTNLITSCTK